MADALLDLLKQVGVWGFLDIAIMALLIYSVLVWLRQTRRAAAILTGIIIVGGVYLFARQFNLSMTENLLHAFFAVFLVALIIIFQEELRHFFEQVAQWSLQRRLPLSKRTNTPPPDPAVDVLIRVLSDLAREQIGALVVLRGKDLLIRHLEGGVILNGEVSEPLLHSIFDPHSAGHDGAAVIEGTVVDQFTCHLPLSKNIDQLQGRGTRHAAALGLSELTDALCLVVSEERGTISAARRGELRVIPDPAQLAAVIDDFYRETGPARAVKPWQDYLKRNSREKAIAVAAAFVLWFVLVHESRIEQQTIAVPVRVDRLPATLAITELQPQVVSVSFSGPRKAFYWLRTETISVRLDAWDLEAGQHTVTLTSADLSLPQSLQLESIDPRRVTVTVDRKPPPTTEP